MEERRRQNGSDTEGAGSYREDDAVLVVDVFNDFDHDDGDRLLDSFRERAPNMRLAIDAARATGVPVVYANDARGWQDDAPRVVHEALSGKGGELIQPLVPHADEPVLLKHRYSAFDHTPLDIFLGSRNIERVLLVGAATEGCVVQTAIDARELALKASIVANACATTDAELEQVALRYASLVGGVRLERITQDGRGGACLLRSDAEAEPGAAVRG
jgi:nicotinamidase-related amidase